MKVFLQFSVLLVVSLLFSACASTQPVVNNSIIEDTSMLKPSPHKEGAFYYLKKDVDFNMYNKIVVPTIPIVKDAMTDSSMDESLLTDISAYFRMALDAELNPIVAKNSGQGSLTLEVSVTSLGKEYKDLKFWQYIPVGLAVTAVKRGVGKEDKNLVINIALKIIDTQTKEVIGIVVDSDMQEGFEKNQKITLSDVKPSLEAWVEHYKVRLIELTNK